MIRKGWSDRHNHLRAGGDRLCQTGDHLPQGQCGGVCSPMSFCSAWTRRDATTTDRARKDHSGGATASGAPRLLGLLPRSGRAQQNGRRIADGSSLSPAAPRARSFSPSTKFSACPRAGWGAQDLLLGAYEMSCPGCCRTPRQAVIAGPRRNVCGPWFFARRRDGEGRWTRRSPVLPGGGHPASEAIKEGRGSWPGFAREGGRQVVISGDSLRRTVQAIVRRSACPLRKGDHGPEREGLDRRLSERVLAAASSHGSSRSRSASSSAFSGRAVRYTAWSGRVNDLLDPRRGPVDRMGSGGSMPKTSRT
jgi:hypothetical protein